MSEYKCPVCGMEAKHHGETCTTGNAVAVQILAQTPSMFALLTEVMQWHSDPNSADYNGCDKDPCWWCEDAKRVLEALEGAKP